MRATAVISSEPLITDLLGNPIENPGGDQVVLVNTREIARRFGIA